MHYKLTLSKNEDAPRSLILLPIDINKLVTPLFLKREEKKESTDAEGIKSYKKRSEQVEYVDEEYEKLSAEESQPLILEDSDGRGFKGRFQTVKNTVNNYYIFVNTGKMFRVIPISKWYKFSAQINYDTLSLEEAEKRMGKDDDRWMMHKKKEEEIEEIDYVDVFDDDDGEEMCVMDYEEKKLSTSGKELKKLFMDLEENEEATNKEDTDDEKNQNMAKIGRIENEKRLTEDDLVQIIKNEEMSIKELLSRIKLKYKIDEHTKSLVQKFVKERCEYKKETIEDEKVIYKLKLKS